MASRDRTHVGFARWFVWHLLRWVWKPIAAVLFRPRVRGADQLPDTGYLLLANHTAPIDTLWVAAPTGRVTHFMTSAARFRNPRFGRILTFFNCFPKTVGSRDPSATEAVKALLDAGQVVQIMPEGTRTWDGRLQPIRPSIGALVKRYQAPVVLCRVQTGHLLWPRWARFPRWIPLVVEYSAVREWDPEEEVETIWQDIVEGLTLDPDTAGLQGPTASRARAEGLPAYLWACPVCFEHTTTASGHTLSCTACGAHWEVTLDHRLEGTPTLTVAGAWDRIEAHHGEPPRVSDSVILEGAVEVSAFDTGEQLWAGLLRVHEEELIGPEGWRLRFAEIKNVYLDAGNVLVVRCRERPQLRLAPATQSTHLWHHFLSLNLEFLRQVPKCNRAVIETAGRFDR